MDLIIPKKGAPMAANHDLTPRLKNSVQWTELPTELIDKIKSVFESEFQTEAAQGDFLVEGRLYQSEVVLRIGFLEKGRLKQINFEASMDIPTVDADQNQVEEQNSDLDNFGSSSPAMNCLYSCIDSLGCVMDEYFDLASDDEIDIPTNWEEYDFEGEQIYLRHSTVNTRLEQEADRLLGLVDERLVKGPESDQDLDPQLD